MKFDTRIRERYYSRRDIIDQGAGVAIIMGNRLETFLPVAVCDYHQRLNITKQPQHLIHGGIE